MKVLIYGNGQSTKEIKQIVQTMLATHGYRAVIHCSNNYPSSFESSHFYDLCVIEVDQHNVLQIIDILKETNKHTIFIFYGVDAGKEAELIQKGYCHALFLFSDHMLISFVDAMQYVLETYEKQTISITYKGDIYRIHVLDVLYVYAKGNYIYILYDEHTFKVRNHLANYRFDQTYSMFHYVDKATIINMDKVYHVDCNNDIIYFTNGKRISASKRGIQDIKKLLAREKNQ